MRGRILLIEDEPGLVMALRDRFAREGYGFEAAHDGNEGLARALEGGFDLIILDVMLPGKDGFAICQELRGRDILTPILMLTARAQVRDRVAGLKIGADDYLTKPFEMTELLARVEARMRRAAAAPTPTTQGPQGRFTFSNIEADFPKGEVLREGQPVALSAKELHLLQYFVEHKGAILSRDELLHRVWGYEGLPSTRTVDVHVAWLRRKLEANPSRPVLITTVHGQGYKFVG